MKSSNRRNKTIFLAIAMLLVAATSWAQKTAHC